MLGSDLPDVCVSSERRDSVAVGEGRQTRAEESSSRISEPQRQAGCPGPRRGALASAVTANRLPEYALVTPPTPPRVPSGDPRSRPVTLAVPPPFTVKETEVECSGLACRVMTDEWPSWG